jgi:hypothetical protein
MGTVLLANVIFNVRMTIATAAIGAGSIYAAARAIGVPSGGFAMRHGLMFVVTELLLAVL